MNTNPASFIKKQSASIGFKAVLIVVLLLIFLIPISFVKSIVRDRQLFEQHAVDSILEPVGGEMVLQGLSLHIEYDRVELSELKNADGSTQRVSKVEKHFLVLSPARYQVAADAESNNLTRGIFTVPTYKGLARVSADFELPHNEALIYDKNGVLTNKVLLVLGVSNNKNLTALPEFFINSQKLGLTEIKRDFSRLYANTVQYDLPLALKKGEALNLTGTVSFQGGTALSFAPLGGDNVFSLHSDWKTPGFSGGWLPLSRDISAKGFDAQWQIAGISTAVDMVAEYEMLVDQKREYSEKYNDYTRVPAYANSGTNLKQPEHLVRAEFFMPVSGYQKTERSIKYALLFLLVPFLTIFLCEIFLKIRIHPVQYCLIGLANVIFYLLLLSISEHLSFNASFLLSAAGVTILTAVYVGSILKNFKWSGVIAVVQSVSYVFLFGTLQAEDYALLIGSLGLFTIIAILMFITRKIDWYGKTEGE